MSSHFQPLPISRVERDTAQAVCVTFAVPPALREAYRFAPGQFLTLRASIDGADLRRSYSIYSSTQHYLATGELSVGIKQVSGGAFSSFAQGLQPGSTLQVLPPEGRFTPSEPDFTAQPPGQATHRLAFAAGSGITPVLSIIASSLAADAASCFTLIYSNRNMASVMFAEALQDLKDRYPARLVLHHLFSRQSVECALYNGRLDATKATQLLAQVVSQRIDEAFVCGPEAMIEACEAALLASGLAPEQVRSERFASSAVFSTKPIAQNLSQPITTTKITLELIADGKTHVLPMQASDTVLDVALAAGLDLPYSCRAGVCCTCRARVLDGSVTMAKNYTLEASEVQQGFVLSCQARAAQGCERVVVSFDER